jgi:hypothetical protein
MTQTLEQTIEANRLELERLTAIYTEISEYAKQKHGISLFELECAIEQADHLDNMLILHNPSIDENFYYE